MKKFLKKLGWYALGSLALILLISFFLPSTYIVERSVRIDAPVSVVFAQVNELHNWVEWSPWYKLDPVMEVSYSNPHSGQSAFFKWRSDHKEVGNGQLTLTEVVPGEKIVTFMELEKRRDESSTFTFEQEKSGTRLTWSMENKIGFNPLMKYGAYFQKRALKKMFDQGLSNIKEIAESQQ
jgi:uncharacterized protein YndB with AHSA1/START domain